MQKCPDFRMKLWFRIFCHIFSKLFAKNVKGGSDNYEIWCVEQLNRAEKKVQNSIFVRPALHGANIFQISFTICIIKQIFGEVFTSHIQLVLNIFVTPSALDWRDAFSGPRLWSWPYLQENSWCTVACMLLQSRKAGVKRWFFFGNNFLETIYSFWGRRCQVRFK